VEEGHDGKVWNSRRVLKLKRLLLLDRVTRKVPPGTQVHRTDVAKLTRTFLNSLKHLHAATTFEELK